MTETGRFEGTDEMGTNLVKCLEAAAKETLRPVKKITTNNEIWKNDTLLNNLVGQRKCFPRNSENYKRITRDIKSRVNHLRNEKIAKEAMEMNEFASRRQIAELYRSFKNDNSTFKEIKTSKRCNPIKLKEYFKKHFEAQKTDKDPVELVNAPSYIQALQKLSSIHIKTGPPDLEELIRVIKKFKQGKAVSDTPIAFIKHAIASREFLLEIEKLYKTVWETKMIPSDWSHTKLNAIWKGPSKGKYDDPSAYRGLQVGSSFCKILITIIIKRLKNWYERQLSEQQQGFRASRGTTDGIFIAKQMQQITAKMKKPTYVLFVDLSAAFDHVERSWMFKSITNRFPTNSNITLIQLIKTLYEHTTTALAETPDDKFELTAGVRQGGPESPMLYNLYMD